MHGPRGKFYIYRVPRAWRRGIRRGWAHCLDCSIRFWWGLLYSWANNSNAVLKLWESWRNWEDQWYFSRGWKHFYCWIGREDIHARKKSFQTAARKLWPEIISHRLVISALQLKDAWRVTLLSGPAIKSSTWPVGVPGLQKPLKARQHHGGELPAGSRAPRPGQNLQPKWTLYQNSQRSHWWGRILEEKSPIERYWDFQDQDPIANNEILKQFCGFLEWCTL